MMLILAAESVFGRIFARLDDQFTHLFGLAWTVVKLILVLIVILMVIGGIAAVVEEESKKADRSPEKESMPDFSIPYSFRSLDNSSISKAQSDEDLDDLISGWKQLRDGDD